MQISFILLTPGSGVLSQSTNSSLSLEKQLTKLQTEIDKINQIDKDDETKQKEVKPLQLQIQKITMQIQHLEDQQMSEQKQINTSNQTDTLEISSKAAALFEREVLSSDELSGVGKANLK